MKETKTKQGQHSHITAP